MTLHGLVFVGGLANAQHDVGMDDDIGIHECGLDNEGYGCSLGDERQLCDACTAQRFFRV